MKKVTIALLPIWSSRCLLFVPATGISVPAAAVSGPLLPDTIEPCKSGQKHKLADKSVPA